VRHDEVAGGQLGRQSAAGAGGDDEVERPQPVGASAELRGAKPDAGDLESAPREVGPGRSGNPGEAQVTCQPARLDVDGGKDDDPRHTPDVGGVAFACRLRSQAA
jgi:hypothetical protein